MKSTSIPAACFIFWLLTVNVFFSFLCCGILILKMHIPILTMVQKGRIPAWKNYLSIEYIDAVYEILTA